jgi:endonuclease G, mitochondrial
LEFATKLPVQRRKRLCADTVCALVIKEYADKQKAFGKPEEGAKKEKVPGVPTRTSPRNANL